MPLSSQDFDRNGLATKALLARRKLAFANELLTWNVSNEASFPWRKTKDPFRILVTEVLLRKTTRKQVNAVYPHFFEEFPDILSLANARVQRIRKVIVSLGMGRQRAVLLKKLGERLKESGGSVPLDKERLLALPGVGRYTANAVLCFCGHQDVALVDTNIIRLTQRVFSSKSSKARPRDDVNVWNFVASLIPTGKAPTLNLSMLDLTASICKARKPKCDVCPLNKICDFFCQQQEAT